MSRNSKNSRKLQAKKQNRRAKLQGVNAVSTGNKGPAATITLSKKNAWFKNGGTNTKASKMRPSRKSEE